MKTHQRIIVILALILNLALSSCGSRSTPLPAQTGPLLYKDPSQPVAARVEDLLARMSLDEKIGQMTQAENRSISPRDVTRYALGSVMTGGDGISFTSTVADWAKYVGRYQDSALQTPLAIPLIYGVDSVHGFALANGATIFPHNIGLGATRNPDLVRKIGQITAKEMRSAGIPWDFAPVVAAAQDIRWGRTYEGFSEDTQLVVELSSAYIKGLQTGPDFKGMPGQRLYAGATAKHFIGDGGTQFGTSNMHIIRPYLLDQGDMRFTEKIFRSLFLPPYKAAVDNDVMSVMVSYSSWNGTKMHANKYMLTDVLKGELGFKGFVVSDWGGIGQIDPTYEKAVVTAINAGVDMSMVPHEYVRFIKVMKQAVARGEISMERIDDAVRRILRAKFMLGLFEMPHGDPTLAAEVGSDAHRQLARQAVRESLVLLKNDDHALPIAKDVPSVFVAGRGGDSVGMQCGGWIIAWQGREQLNLKGSTSILGALRSLVSPDTKIQYNKSGKFDGTAEVGIVVVGETPYAEGAGDREDLRLDDRDIEAINTLRPHVEKLIVVLLSGRPMIITKQLPSAEAWVAAWLPGAEGEGVTDVLFGDYPFVGKLPYTWPRSNAQLPLNKNNVAGKTSCQSPLFPFGYGLGKAGSQPIQWIDCGE